MANWTLNQKKAIDIRNKNLLVSAAAGSGKTAVLVERIINLVEEKEASIDSMLIVTFTNAAAGEMKERIQKKLSQRIKDIGVSQDKKELETLSYLKDQSRRISRASISTVHSFCIDLIRENFQIIDIDPSFRIANESTTTILRARAGEELFEKNYDNENQDFLDLVDVFATEKSDKRLLEMVNQIYNFVQSQPYPEKWLKEVSSYYELEGEDDEALLNSFDNMLWGKELRKIYAYSINNIIEKCNKAVALCKRYKEPIGYIMTLEDDLSQILKMEKELDGSLKIFSDKVNTYKASRLASINKKKIEENGYAEEDILVIKDIRNDIKKEIGNIGEFAKGSFVNYIKDIKLMAPSIAKLTQLVIDYENEYAKLKREAGVIDFSDLEHMAIKILENEGVRQGLREKITHIFFDEYQDSNMVQETIIESIKRDNNLFFVGDVKQSIYRFRLADPTLFNKRYSLYNEDSDVSHKIDLSKNFRSRKEILDFCNFIFSNIMTVSLGEVDYQNEAHQLVAGNLNFDDWQKHIQLCIIETPKTEVNLEEDEDQEEELGAEELEAVYIGNQIKELCKGGEKYSDIAILMRSPKNKVKIFEKVLTEMDIPYYIDFTTSTFEKIEVKTLIDYLKIIDNQNQDEALLGALLSPIGGFQIQDIIEIRLFKEELPFHLAVKLYQRENKDELANKIKMFFEKVEEFFLLEKIMPLSDFIWKIVEDTSYSTYIHGLPEGKQRLVNIKNMVKKAGEYDAGEAKGLYGFLRHIDKILKEKGDTGDKSSIIESENAVTIMSIHKSKGLEFNTVFVCDLGKKINEIDLRNDLIMDNTLGISVKFKDPELNVESEMLPRNIIKEKKALENLSEEIRILYVALTRAVNRLYLVGSTKNVEKLIEKASKGDISNNIRKQKSYLEWIVNPLVRDVKAMKLRAVIENGVRDEDLLDSKSNYIINIVKGESLKKDKIETAKEKEVIKKELQSRKLSNKTLEDKLSKYSKFKYNFAKDTKEPNKRSVTELTKSYENLNEYHSMDVKLVSVPKFMQEKENFTKIDIGILMHLVMEHISLKHHEEQSIILELEDMYKRELLTKDELEIIEPKRILNFFNSDIGKTLLESQKVEREKSFLMKIEDTLVEGIIDCFFEQEDGFVLIDYKTDAEVDESKHIDQLNMYAQAIEKMYSKKVKEKYIYWLNHNKFTKV